MDKQRRNNLTVELIGALRARDHGTTGHALVVPEEILYQERLAGFTLADKNHDLVMLNTGHVELTKPEVQAFGCSS